MGTNWQSRHSFIESIERRVLLTVFAPDLSFQPPIRPAGTVASDQVFPISEGRYIIAHRVQASSEDDTFITYSRVSVGGALDKTFGKKGHLTFDAEVVNASFSNSRFFAGAEGDTGGTLSVYTFNGKPDESVGSGTGIITLTINRPAGRFAIDDVKLQHLDDDGSMLVSVTVDLQDENNKNEYQLLKLNPDGTLNQSFGENGIATIPASSASLNDVLVTDNGIYAYLFRGFGVTPPSDLLERFTPDGNVDNTFGTSGTLTIPAFAEDITELPNGKIVLLENQFGKPDAVHRFNHDGTDDTSLNGTGSVVVNVPASAQKTVAEVDQNVMFFDSQNRALVATGGTIFRYSSSGTLDAYPFNGTAPFDGFTISEDDQGRLLTNSKFGGPIDQRYDLVQSTQLDSNGIAHIVGTSGDDVVTVHRISNDRYQFVVNGETTDLSAPSVKEIDINLFNGNNQVNIDSSVDAPVDVQSGNGDDSIVTGDGDDTINPGTGTDTLHCGNGDDSIDTSDPAIDDQTLSPAIRHIAGGTGNKGIENLNGKAIITLGVGNSTIKSFVNTAARITIAGGGNTISLIGSNNTVVIGGHGNNTVAAGESGDQQITTGDGNDTITITGADHATIHGGGGNDNITANGEPDFIYGEGGNDTIEGVSGADYISGGGGKDNINGGNGNDTIIGGDGDDILSGGAGDDYLSGQTGNDLLDAGTGIDTLIAGAGQR